MVEMKVMREVVVKVCDICGKEFHPVYLARCLVCGKDVCGEHNATPDMSVNGLVVALCSQDYERVTLKDVVQRLKAEKRR